jgi:hypothetical protein
MARLLVGFDVDGTLIDGKDKPREDIVEILRLLSKYCDIMVWSGGGQQYAETIGRRLNLPEEVSYQAKTSGVYPDVAFDDVESFILADKVINV